jgi:hypothetical protein
MFGMAAAPPKRTMVATSLVKQLLLGAEAVLKNV